MKKIYLLLLIALTLVITACASEQGDASVPDGFVVVSSDDININVEVIEIKHIDTGCHFMYVDGYKNGGLVQMYVETENGNMPYCD